MTAFADVPAERLTAAREFWSTVSGASVGAATGGRGEFVPLEPPDGDSYLWLQRVDRPEPGWHVDLHVGDLADGVRHAVSLGAAVTDERPSLAVLTTPAGQPFCLAGEPGARRRPEPYQWPDGHHSLVDQICLDIPAPAFDRDLQFWAELTGWDRRHGTVPEFEHLIRPQTVPLRLLLQRLGPDDADGARAHLDLSSNDVPAEQARHLALGAVVVRVTDHWITLRDPAGLIYCITNRQPGR